LFILVYSFHFFEYTMAVNRPAYREHVILDRAHNSRVSILLTNDSDEPVLYYISPEVDGAILPIPIRVGPRSAKSEIISVDMFNIRPFKPCVTTLAVHCIPERVFRDCDKNEIDSIAAYMENTPLNDRCYLIGVVHIDTSSNFRLVCLLSVVCHIILAWFFNRAN